MLIDYEQCEDKFYFLEKMYRQLLDWNRQKQNGTEKFKNIIYSLSVKNDRLENELEILKTEHGTTNQLLYAFKKTVEDLCFEVSKYIDAEKLEEDLKTKCFDEDTKTLLYQILESRVEKWK